MPWKSSATNLKNVYFPQNTFTLFRKDQCLGKPIPVIAAKSGKNIEKLYLPGNDGP